MMIIDSGLLYLGHPVEVLRLWRRSGNSSNDSRCTNENAPVGWVVSLSVTGELFGCFSSSGLVVLNAIFARRPPFDSTLSVLLPSAGLDIIATFIHR